MLLFGNWKENRFENWFNSECSKCLLTYKMHDLAWNLWLIEPSVEIWFFFFLKIWIRRPSRSGDVGLGSYWLSVEFSKWQETEGYNCFYQKELLTFVSFSIINSILILKWSRFPNFQINQFLSHNWKFSQTYFLYSLSLEAISHLTLPTTLHLKLILFVHLFPPFFYSWLTLPCSLPETG